MVEGALRSFGEHIQIKKCILNDEETNKLN